MAEKAKTTATTGMATVGMDFFEVLSRQTKSKPTKKAASKAAVAGTKALDSLLGQTPKPAGKSPTEGKTAPPVGKSESVTAKDEAKGKTATTAAKTDQPDKPMIPSDIERFSSLIAGMINSKAAKSSPKEATPQEIIPQEARFCDVFTDRHELVKDEDASENLMSDGLFGAEAFVSNDKLHLVSKKDGPIRVAAYIRVSTDHENQEDSYELQDRYFTQLLESNPNWVSAGVYSDYGISATDQTHRTGFNRLIRHCREGKVDRIICKSISRFARNTADFLTAISILRDHGVSMMFEKENLDTANPTSEFILTTLGAIAQEESRSISENQKWGLRKRMPKGEVQNKVMYGYRFVDGEDAYEVLDTGYRIRKIEIVEEEAAIVRRIFEEYIDGKSFNAISRGLNIDRVPAPPQNKVAKRNAEKAKQILSEMNGAADAASATEDSDTEGPGWTGGRVSYINKQVRFTGNVLAQQTYVESYLTHKSVKNDGAQPQYYIREHHPAIITEEMFEEAQRIRSMNPNVGKKSNAKPLPFSGIILCGNCGRVYNVRGTSSKNIWFCPSASWKGGATRCRAERLYEEQVIRMFRKAVLDRFDLYTADIQDDAKTADILSGKFEEEAQFSEKSNGFIERMIIRMEQIQRDDYVEKDRAFGKRKIYVLRMEANRAERTLRVITSKLKAAQVHKETLGQDVPAEELEELQKRLLDAEVEAAKAKKRLETEEEAFSQKECYWDEIEANYSYRQKALEWMKNLPHDSKGVVDFLNGMETDFVKAFVLGVIVFDPLHFQVRWYDNTTTDVELYSNVDEGRCKERRV